MTTSRSTPVFEIYTDKKGEFRWRARAKNGNLLAAASEGYKDKRDAVHCAKLFGYDPKAVVAVKPAAKPAEKKAAKPAEAAPPAEAVAVKPKRVVKPKPTPAAAPEGPAAEG